MSGPLIKSVGAKVILSAYYTGVDNLTGGGLSPIMTAVVDTYGAYASSVYTFPKDMRAKVTARGTITAIAGSTNGFLYIVQSGGTAFPCDYRDYCTIANIGEVRTLGVEFVYDFLAGNRIAIAFVTTTSNARLLGTTIPGCYTGVTIEEYK